MKHILINDFQTLILPKSEIVGVHYYNATLRALQDSDVVFRPYEIAFDLATPLYESIQQYCFRMPQRVSQNGVLKILTQDWALSLATNQISRMIIIDNDNKTVEIDTYLVDEVNVKFCFAEAKQYRFKFKTAVEKAEIDSFILKKTVEKLCHNFVYITDNNVLQAFCELINEKKFIGENNED